MGKSFFIKGGIKKAGAAFLLFILILASALIGLALPGKVSTNYANAITPTYTQNGGYVKSVDRAANPMVYTCDNVLTLLGHSENLYGDFLKEGAGVPVITGDENTGDGNGYLRIDEYSNDLKLAAYIGIDPTSEFAQAIQDKLVVVKIIPYFVYADPTVMDGADVCDFIVTYYSGEFDYELETPKPISYFNKYTNSFGQEDDYDPNAKKTAGSLILPSTFIAEETPYLKMEMNNFQKVGFNFSIAVKTMGFTVEYQTEDGILIEQDVALSRIDNIDGNRITAAPDDMVKANDIIRLSTYVQKSAISLALNKTSNASGTVTDGKFFRKIFLTDLSLNRTIINFNFSSDQLERIYDYSYDGSNYDISSDYSGEIAYFRVLPSTNPVISITAMLWRYDNIEMNGSTTFTYYLDGLAAYSPQLSTSSNFYSKYIDNGAYFTNKVTYITENVVEEGVTVSKISGVDLCLSDARPLLASDSLLLRGGDIANGVNPSGQLVYYKIRRLAPEEEIPTYGQTSNGFEVEEADGVFCTIESTGDSYYNNLILPLKDESGPETVYHSNGIYAIELITCDYVGNKAIGNIVYFVKVDVADYGFTYKYQLGDGTTVDKQVSTSDVSLSFATLSDTGVMSAYVAEPVFKRGDKISVRAKFTTTGNSAYILTFFKTTGVGIATTDERTTSWSGLNVTVNQMDLLYTFEVNTMFSENPTARVMTLIFKQRAIVEVTNTQQNYDGDGKAVKAQLRIDGSTIIAGINISVFYSTDNLTFTTILPINAGNYYYRCELLNHSRYYGIKTGTFLIRQAEPNINGINVSSLDYGNSLAVIDFDENVYMTENGLSQKMSTYITCFNLADGRYYYYKSADGIIGYFRITGIEKSSEAYINPTAGNMSIIVQFCAIQYTIGAGDTIIFTTTEAGVFVRDENYSLVSRTVSVTINNSESVNFEANNISGDGKVYADYDGNPKDLSFSLTSALPAELGNDLGQFAIVQYTRLNEVGEEGEYTSEVPINSGNYLVVIEINQTRCNYKGSWTQEFVIMKKQLDVEASDVVCVYQAERHPTPISSLGVGIDKVIFSGLSYAFTYYYYDGSLGSYNEMANEDNLVPSIELFDGVPENAGKYVAKVAIDEINYENTFDVFVTLTINKVVTGNTRLSISYPTLGFNPNNLDSHITYLQPLSQVAVSSNWNVRYTYHEYMNNRLVETVKPVTGSFVIVSRFYDPEIDISEEAYIEEMRDYDSATVGAKLMYLCFVPSEENIRNFNFIYKECEVIVGKARADFGNVTIENIIYGKVISSIEDINITKTVRILKKGIILTAEYYELPQEWYSLSFSTITPENTRLFEVGSHFVDVVFTPNDTASFEIITTSCLITVEKRTLGIIFGTDNYDETSGRYVHTYKGYGNPSIAYTNKVNSEDVVSGSYSFYYQPSGLLCTDTYLAVGDYRVVFVINNANYMGTNEFLCRIDKDTLIAEQTPAIFEETTSVSYNKLMKNVVFNNGIMISTNTGEQVSGTYRLRCEEDDRFLDTGIRKQYPLEFVPADSHNYESYGLDNSYQIFLTVAKADVSEGLILDIPTFTYGELFYNFIAASIFTYTTIIWTDGTSYSESQIDESYDYLAVAYVVSNLPSSGIVSAGSYRVTAQIIDDNYAGIKIAYLEVLPKQAFIEVVNNDKVFSNKSQTVTTRVKDAEENIINETVLQAFYMNGIRTDSIPSEIGKYQVVLTLNSSNYTATMVNTELTIRVDRSQITITNTEQTYTIQRNLGISLGLNTAVYSLSFYDSANGIVYTNMPTNAGFYDIRLTFLADDNDGYYEVIEYTNLLVINKFNANIVVATDITTVYTNRLYALNFYTDPYGLNVVKKYCYEDSEVYLEEEIYDVGQHKIKLTVQDANYKGEIVINYNIIPANLSVAISPEFGHYVYNSNQAPVLITEGEVDFGSTERDVEGVFEIDVDDIKYLSVGVHTVIYTFTASTEGILNKNYNPIQGQVSIIIVKKTINAENINIGVSSGFYVNYDGKYHGVDAYLAEGVIYDSNGINSDLTLTVYYNGITNLPREKGEYTVRAVVSSKNYDGEKIASSNFVIDFGNPEIREKPSLIMDNFSVGDTITTLDITGGKAYLEGTTNQINGSFIVTDTLFTKANINKVQIQFEPELSDLYNIVVFEIDVNVSGENPLAGVISYQEWTNSVINVEHDGIYYGQVSISVTPKSGVTPVYGVKTSNFDISFETLTTNASDPSVYLESFGLLAFVDNNYTINVGQSVGIVFTPAGANADVYNIMYGFVAIDIDKADLPLDVEYSLKGFLGKDLNEQNSVFTLYRNGNIIDLDGTFIIYSDSEYQNLYDIDALLAPEDNNKTVYISFVTGNYNEVKLPISLEIYQEIDSSSIIIGIDAKSYDGLPITAESLSISVINTQLPVDAQAISIRVFDSYGNESEGTNVGTYSVYVYVNDSNYYGSAIFSFVVNKQNISQNITLSSYSSVYDSVIAPLPVFSGETLNTSIYKTYYKQALALDGSYSLNVPNDAGNYKVKVVISSDIYEGSEVFDYQIQKLEIRLIANQIYSYVYGSNVVPSVSFKYKDSETILSLEYMIYYYSEFYTKSNILPYNAGNYKAQVVLIDNNYTLNMTFGYAEFNYNITQRVTTITTLPTIISQTANNLTYNLKYGQRLSEARLSGGEATRDGSAIDGYFGFSGGASILSAGTHNVNVVFTPYNNNYAISTAIASIVVAPADATVSFSMLRAAYNGSSRRSVIAYSVAPLGVSVSISFINSQGDTIINPINAGNYSVVVVSNDNNYVVTTSVSLDGTSNPIFVIAKAEASASRSISPNANPISVGESLDKSTLTSGSDFGLIYYNGFNNPIAGSFDFVQSSFVYMTAGVYSSVEYVFSPDDSNNFAKFRGITEITVNRAAASISISNNVFTYAKSFAIPTFATNPTGLKVMHDITFVPYNLSDSNYVYDPSHIINVGTYYFNVWVDDVNYLDNRTEFSITIKKKELDLNFVSQGGSIVTQYQTTYGKRLDANFILYDFYNNQGKSGYLLKDKVIDGIDIKDTYNIRYVSSEGTSVYNSQSSPSERGTYYVTVDIINKNYSATNTIIYKVDRGVIEDIRFDEETLEKQIYGNNVVEPIITTSPSKVSYYIVYQGHNTNRPKDAGSYNITVYFNDENYDKKQVSAMFKIARKDLEIINIKVKDKVYDGVSTLQINGELQGVLYKDEVSLKMSATTLNNEIKVGYHYVNITNYELTGLDSTNYTVRKPSYALQVKISSNKVESAANSSFITSDIGFNEGTTVNFKEISTAANKSNIFTKALGTETTIIGYTIKENGAETLIKDQFKVYLAIPEEYRGTDFTVQPAGNLAGETIIFTQEGDFITFHASSSGQVVFTKAEFKYTFVVVAIAALIIIISIIVLFALNPMQRVSKTRDNSPQREAIRKIRRGY